MIELSTLYIVNIIFICLAAISTVLRFYARWSAALALKLDDWLVIPAFVCALVLTILCLIAGKVVWLRTDDLELLVNLAKVKFASQFFHLSGITLAKLSVLFLYKRLFSVNRTPRAVSVLIVATCLWFIAFFFATLFQSGPVNCNYDPLATCPDNAQLEQVYIANATLDVVLDLAILCLPAFFIRKLKVALWKRIALVGIFALGTVILVASIARLAYAVKLDIHWNNFYTESLSEAIDVYAGIYYLWPVIEVSLAVTCVNLPCFATLRPGHKNGPSGPPKRSLRSLLFFSRGRSSGHSNDEKLADTPGPNAAGSYGDESWSRNTSVPQNQSFSGPTRPREGLMASQSHRDLEMNTA